MHYTYSPFGKQGYSHYPALAHRRLFFLLCLILTLGAYSTYGQVGPNCTHINASIGADDTARVMVNELVTNAAQIIMQGDLLDVEIVGSYGQRLLYYQAVNDTFEIAMYACPHIGRQLKVNVSISGGTGGACWSYLTFKQGNGPIILGRSKTVYCFDPLVQGGHIHDVPPQAMVPCRGTEDATFVADWITAFNCDAAALGTAANDTAKIIYRDYEAFDKAGVRGAGYDTIYVLRLPQITVDNAYCPERDTVYCGTGGKIGPYMVAGRMFEYGAMSLIDRHQAISFVETSFNPTTRQLEFKAAEFDPKCGVSVHVDAWPLGSGECSSQYKVNVEIKQTCWGTPGTYAGPGSSNTMTNFIETFHPKHWTYSRSLSSGIITAIGTNLMPADISVFDALGRPNPLLKLIDVAGATDFRLFSNFIPTATEYEYARMCVQLPTEGDLSFTIAGSDGVNAGYRLNGTYVPLSDGAYTFSLEPCDEFCFEDRGADIMVNNLNWTETVVAAPLTMVAPGYWTCEFWVIDLDTLPPLLECDLYAKADSNLVHEDTLYIPAGSHECAAHAYLPPAIVHDDWSGVKFVKAIVPGIATVVFEPSATVKYQWESHKQVKIPHGLPIPIYYEAYDSCHNIAYDTCYVKVKDLTRPVAVCDKGVIVGLSGKKVWVEASTFDEGSWDNCDVNLLLARRADWWTSCVDLCDDDYHVACYDEHDTIWCTDLEEDKHVDEVEAHYYKTMKWLKEDGRECSELLWNAWKYDLCKKRTLECIEHPYPVDDHYFKKLLYELGCAGEFEGGFPTHEDIDEWDQIGGGWSDAVPFDCEDACKEVMVELLVVDYWCNWSKCWTWVSVEDKTPIQVHRDVEERLDLTCAAYKMDMISYPGVDHEVSIEYLVELAKLGDSEAFSQLDQLFGGYEKVWRDEYGNVPAPALGGYDDKVCECDQFSKQEKVYDDHLGYVWKTIYYDSCWTKTRDVPLFFGQVVVNCGQAIECEQTVWCNFDHCGQGYIYREWKFIPGCPDPEEGDHYAPAHRKDTITRKQLIWVGSSCPLDKGMFTRPADITVNTCGIEYDDAGNAAGVLSPEYTGAPEYLFDDDCRIVGISHQDKVFKIVGGEEACYKIVRTWYHIDWCYLGGKPENSTYWWVNPEYAGKTISWEQKIIVIDTIPPVCTFEEELETVEAAGCAYTLDQTVYVDDSCGALNYYYELFSIKGTDKVSIAYGEGDLEGINASFNIRIPDLLTGSYQLKVRVRDECQNESYCIDDFDVITGKKPAAICITSLTAELTPMDLDQDGEIDTAMVTIWANEFDRSSAPACDSDGEIYFRIELLEDASDDSFAGTSDSLVIGCDQVGTQQIRLWVIDEKGSFDYCDVLLVVQNNMGGCPEPVASDDGIIKGNIYTEEGKMIEQVDVSISGGVANSLVTGVDGAYNFDAPVNSLVTIVPKKDINAINGVSTMDLILLTKHITGSSLLTSPYKMIASDVNKDGFINSLDMLEMRSLILGEVDSFAKNTSWRFVTKEYEFTTSNPHSEDFPERLVINLNEPVMTQDFIGIKIADLDLDSDLSRSAPRSGKPLLIQVDERVVSAGEIVDVPVHIVDADHLIGLQYTMQVNGEYLNVLSIDPNDLLSVSADHFGLSRLKHGMYTTAYNTPEILTGVKTKFYTMQIEVLKSGKLSEMLSVNSRITIASAFLADGTRVPVALNFADTPGGSNMRLFQNEPNPAITDTRISFYLPGKTSAKLVFYTIDGKILREINGDYEPGLHTITMDVAALDETGVIYYELITDTDKIGRKMILH